MRASNTTPTAAFGYEDGSAQHTSRAPQPFDQLCCFRATHLPRSLLFPRAAHEHLALQFPRKFVSDHYSSKSYGDAVSGVRMQE